MFCSLELLGESRTNVSFHKVYNAPLVDPKKEKKNEGGHKIFAIGTPNSKKEGKGIRKLGRMNLLIVPFLPFCCCCYIHYILMANFLEFIFDTKKGEKRIFFSRVSFFWAVICEPCKQKRK